MDLVDTLSVFGSVVVDQGQAQRLGYSFSYSYSYANPEYGFINNNEVLSNARWTYVR